MIAPAVAVCRWSTHTDTVREQWAREREVFQFGALCWPPFQPNSVQKEFSTRRNGRSIKEGEGRGNVCVGDLGEQSVRVHHLAFPLYHRTTSSEVNWKDGSFMEITGTAQGVKYKMLMGCEDVYLFICLFINLFAKMFVYFLLEEIQKGGLIQRLNSSWWDWKLQICFWNLFSKSDVFYDFYSEQNLKTELSLTGSSTPKTKSTNTSSLCFSLSLTDVKISFLGNCNITNIDFMYAQKAWYFVAFPQNHETSNVMWSALRLN